MKLLAVMSHKGGVGKTTSAVLLAEELAAKGFRTLLIDADRQQGAGLLLEVGSPTGEVQPTRVPGLDYLGSGKFTEAEVAANAAAVNDRYDIGIVDTPAVDDNLAASWLQQATATLMIMQVEPLTVKTFPNALATLEGVRRLNPLIELVGLLPTMFDANEQTHRTCLTELLTRRPESVFTPPVPMDLGLMHRGAGDGAPEIGPAARQAYQCAADRIIRVLQPSRTGATAGPLPAGADRVSGAPVFAANGGAPVPPPAWPSGHSAPVSSPFPAPPTPGDAAASWPGSPTATPASPFGSAPPPFAPPGHGYPVPAPPAPQAAYPDPAAGWPALPAATGAAGTAPAYPPVVPAGPPHGTSPYPQAPAASPQWPQAAPGSPAASFDADEREPDWFHSDSGASSARVFKEARPRRSSLAAPFAMGFAAACVLALLIWAFVARRVSAPPAHATPRIEQQTPRPQRVPKEQDGANRKQPSGSRSSPGKDAGEARIGLRLNGAAWQALRPVRWMERLCCEEARRT